MKTIIAGSRYIHDYTTVLEACNHCPWQVTSVVSGTAFGVDTLGERWAKKNNLKIHQFKPDWGRFGKKAGPIRNEAMAKASDALILVWDGKSRGSASMLGYAKKYNLLIHEVIV